MADLTIKPIGSTVAVQFLDDDDDDDDDSESPSMGMSSPVSEESYNELCYAICIAVGPDAPKGIKRGDTLLVRESARNCMHVDDVYFVDLWSIAGTVSV